MTSNPDIVIDEDNNMFVVWAGVAPLVDPDNYWLRHIYERTATINPDNTVLWNDSINELTSEFLQYNWTECMYPDASPTSDDKIYILFQADDLAGAYMKGLNITGYSGQTSITENQMIVVSPLKTDLGAPGVGVNEKNKPSFSVSPNYPNPFRESTSIGLSLKKSGNVSILITNLIGQNLIVMDKGFVNAGSYRYMVDGSGLTPGIYFCTVKVDNASFTQKMIVE